MMGFFDDNFEAIMIGAVGVAAFLYFRNRLGTPVSASISAPVQVPGQQVVPPGPVQPVYPIYPERAFEDVAPDKACPPGYKFNRASIPCRNCGVEPNNDKPVQPSFYRLKPNENPRKFPRCISENTQVQVDPCPAGSSRSICTEMSNRCPTGQKPFPFWQCGPCAKERKS